MIRNFINALQFLTIFTVSRKQRPAEGDLAKSLPYFPAVGFLIGLCLVYADQALARVLPHTISNALLVLLAIVLTRALHVDGLADTLDGFMGGADREAKLRIMKDSSIGTAGAIGIIFLLFLKYLSLNILFSDNKTAALLMAPLLGRWSQTLMVFRAAYARENGMGRAFSGRLGTSGMIAAAVVAIVLSAFVAGLWALVFVPSVLIVALLARWYIVRALGGVTGDTVGAVSELSETLVLLLCVVIFGGG
jgi:adenosylcobinamide-GDP ribazoletransferase